MKTKIVKRRVASKSANGTPTFIESLGVKRGTKRRSRRGARVCDPQHIASPVISGMILGASADRPLRVTDPRSASKAGGLVGRPVIRAKARAPRPLAKLWQLRLYVTGQTDKSLTAFVNLKKICESQLKGRYRIQVIDLLKHPHLARGDQILAIPTVVRKLPKPVRTIVGTLSDLDRVLVGLDLRAAN